MDLPSASGNLSSSPGKLSDRSPRETPDKARSRARIDRLVSARVNDRQEYANKSCAQSGGISNIERTNKTIAPEATGGGVRNNESNCDHHQSVDEDEVVALNQFRIGVTQQEFKQEQQHQQRRQQLQSQRHSESLQLGTISCGSGSCASAIGKRDSVGKKVESIGSVGCGCKLHADKQPRPQRQQASLDQLELVASREERKRKRIYGNLPSGSSANISGSCGQSNNCGKTVSGQLDSKTLESAAANRGRRETLCSGGTDGCVGGGFGSLKHNMTPSSSTIVRDFDDHTGKPQAQQQTLQINNSAASHHTTSQVDSNLHGQDSSRVTESNFVVGSGYQRQQLIPLIVRPSDRPCVAGDNYPSSSFANQMILKQQQSQQQQHQRAGYLNGGAKYSDYIIDRSNARTAGGGETIDEATPAFAVNQQRMEAPTTNYNHNNQTHMQSGTSPRSSSSTTSTPSPRTSHSDMQALAVARHSTTNQLISAAELDHSSAMAVAADSHLDHLNHQYIASAAAAGLSHQHYAAYGHQQANSSIGNQQQSHHIATNQDQASAYNHLQHQQQRSQSQHLQQHQQQQQQQREQVQESQQQQQTQQAISSQQLIYNQIASGAVGNNHNGGSGGYGATGVTNTNSHYHSQLHASSSDAVAHQTQLNSAAAACAAAAVVSQTLKTVANQHNQHHPHNHHYGSGAGISNGFAAGASSAAGLMNMTAQHHSHFHGLGGQHQQHQHQQHHPLNHHSHHLGQQHVSLGTIQSNQQHQLQQSHHVHAPHHTATAHHHHQLQQHQQQQQHQAAAVVHSLMPVHHHHHHPASHSIIARKYQCKMCPQVFMSKAEMKYHNQQHLREAKPYKCLQCPKAFANSSYLSQHMRIHQGLKPYTCDICSRKFTQLSHLQQHKRTHTGDKPYKCNYMNCTKQFSQLSNLQSHSRCHQLDKPYKCNSCYKCFHDEQSLLEHIPRHLESKHLKRNLCIFCGSSYQQERGLVKHFQQYHTDKSPTLVAAAIAAGTTGNTSLIASLVSSTQSKFAAPPSGGGSTTSSISSVGGNGGGGVNITAGIQGGGGGGGMIGGNSNQPVAHSNNSSNTYQLSAGFH